MLLLVSTSSATSSGTSSLAKNATSCWTPSSNTSKSLPVSPVTYLPFMSVTVTVSGTISTPLLKTVFCALSSRRETEGRRDQRHTRRVAARDESHDSSSRRAIPVGLAWLPGSPRQKPRAARQRSRVSLGATDEGGVPSTIRAGKQLPVTATLDTAGHRAARRCTAPSAGRSGIRSSPTSFHPSPSRRK